MSDTKLTAKRNRTIDFIKGLAIILVVITHFEWTESERMNPFFSFVIDMAVPVFMIISGYTYSLSYERHGIRNIEDSYRWAVIKPKAIRYSIPFFIVVLWEVLDNNINIRFDDMSEFVRWVLSGTAGPGSYYYPILMQLIFLFPLIYLVFEKRGRHALYICFALNGAYEILKWAWLMNEECYRLLIFRYIFLIGVGIYIYKGESLKTIERTGITAAGAAFIIITKYTGYNAVIINYWTGTSFIASLVIVPVVFWLLKTQPLRFMPIEVIGKASYHIFLTQMVYYCGYYKMLKEIIDSRLELLLSGIIICTAIGYVFYRIETKVTKNILLIHQLT